MTNLRSHGEPLQLSDKSLKDQIKSEIIHLLHTIINDGTSCYVDNKRLMK